MTIAVTLERKLRPYVKATIYNRLYNGDLTIVNRCVIAGYKHLPGAHPLVKATLDPPARPTNAQEARAQGYTVDSSTYPWVAYKGPYGHPQDWVAIYTDDEQAAWDAVALWRRRTLLVSLVAVVALLLPGCAAFDPPPEGWDATPIHKPLPARYIEVPRGGLEQECGWIARSGHYLYGCARRRYDLNQCLIYHSRPLTPWEKEHEEKHCAGYEHPVVGAVRVAQAPSR